jgi:hypothetical protein
MRESFLKLIRQNKLIKRTLTYGEKSKKENMVLIWNKPNIDEQKSKVNKARNN